MAQEFEGYTFDDANELLTSLSSNVNDMNFYNDSDSKLSGFSPNSQGSGSFSNADDPWLTNIAVENPDDFIKREFDYNIEDFQDYSNLPFDGNNNFVVPDSGNVDEHHLNSAINSDSIVIRGTEPNNFNTSMAQNQQTNDFLATPESISTVSPSIQHNTSRPNTSLTNTANTTPEQVNKSLSNAAAATLASHTSPSSELIGSSLDSEEESKTSKTLTTKTNKTAKEDGKVTKPKKNRASHKMVEKKYRTNINAKIIALRDVVPSLRVATLGAGEDGNTVDLDGLTPASKLNKASVLTKAAEYIQHLEKKNKKLQKENDELKNIFSQLGSRNNNNTNSNTNSNNTSPSQNYQNENSGYAQNFYNHQPMNYPPQYNPQYFNQGPPPQGPQPGQNGYGMSMPMRMAMGGMVGMAGVNMFNNNSNDFKGLSSLPIMQIPIFVKFVHLFKISLILYGAFVVFEPFFKSRKGKANKQTSFALLTRGSSVWLSLLIKVFKIRILKSEPTINELEEIHSVINNTNQQFFRPDSSKSKMNVLFIYLQLLKYDETADINMAFVQLFLYKVLLNVSLLFQIFKQTLNEKRQVDIITKQAKAPLSEEYQPLVDNLAALVKSKDVIQRLTNTYFNAVRSINYKVQVGQNQTSYEEICNDGIVNNDLVKFARNIRTNELLRQSIEDYLNYLVKHDDNLEEEDEEDIQNRINRFLVRLADIEKLALPDSIMNLRVKLFISLLDQTKTNETMKIVKRIVNEMSNSDELNGAAETSLEGDDSSEGDELLEEGELSELTNEDIALDELDLEQSKKSNHTIKEENEENEEDDDEQEEQEEQEEEQTLNNKESVVKEKVIEVDDSDNITEDTATIESLGKDINLRTLSKKNAKLLSNKLINGEEFISLTSSLILKYLAVKKYKEAEALLKHLLNYRNTYLFNSEKQITLLSFVSILKVLVQFDKVVNQLHSYEMNTKHSLIVESLIASLRYWIGIESQVTKNINSLNPQLKTDICDSLVKLGVRFSGIEVEK